MKNRLARVIATNVPSRAEAVLDQHPGAAVAISFFRRLRSDYSGAAFRVRRDSDDATQDIGFTPSGLVDVSALTSFVGQNNNGYVVTAYDQSTNGRHFGDHNKSEQPMIVAKGVPLKTNSGLLAVHYDAVDDFLYRSSSVGVSGSDNRFAAAIIQDTFNDATTTGAGDILTIGRNAPSGERWTARISQETSPPVLRVEIAGSGKNSGVTVSLDEPRVAGAFMNGSTLGDNTVVTPSASESVSGTTTLNTVDGDAATNRRVQNSVGPHFHSEILLYPDARSGERTSILTNMKDENPDYTGSAQIETTFVGNPWPDENGDQPTLYHKSNFLDNAYRVLTSVINGGRTYKLRKTTDFQSFTIIDSNYKGGSSRTGTTTQSFQDGLFLPDGTLVIVSTTPNAETGIWTGSDFSSLSFLGKAISNYSDAGIFHDPSAGVLHYYTEDDTSNSTSKTLRHYTAPDNDLLNTSFQSTIIDNSSTNIDYGVGDPEIVEQDGLYWLIADQSNSHPNYHSMVMVSDDLYSWEILLHNIHPQRKGGDLNLTRFNGKWRGMTEFDDNPDDLSEKRVGMWDVEFLLPDFPFKP